MTAPAMKPVPAYDHPPLAPFGITRVGDLTDLDVVGIPVWFATRPNARSIAVSQGKGLTPEQARISAIMEAVEGAVAEQTKALIAEFGTPDEMLSRGRHLVPLEELVRFRGEAYDEEAPRAWVRGVAHGSGRPAFAPYELIGLDMREEFPWDRDAFHISSAGLAAGPSFEFAALAALLELAEHDATTFSDAFGHLEATSRQMRWQAGVHAGLDEAVAKVRAAGLEPRFFDKTNRLGLPVVSAAIVRPVIGEEGGGERFSGGEACRLDAGAAALAALLEAVQSRLTHIGGARDDLEPDFYETRGDVLPTPVPGAPGLAEFAERHRQAPLPRAEELTHAAQLDIVAGKLAAAGHADIFLFDLPGPVEGVHVVRALVPGLKTFVEDGVSDIGLEDLFGAMT
ncbi:YcaO-like family protein [Labrys sp. (in: a-proteobacteria)]|uniref:YcaO-like family protein n=1 Tax=Labrys sp. (in: a-proteobacteria) TaxID=1917972 RepID=UPI0039E70D97